MIILKNSDTDQVIGTITEEQLQFLIDQLKEEDEQDQDCWIDRETLDVLKDDDADPELIYLLDNAIGFREGIEFSWIRS